jgi:hypothetical protein
MNRVLTLVLLWLSISVCFAQGTAISKYYHFVAENPVKATIDLLVQGTKAQGWIYINDYKGFKQTYEVVGSFNILTKEVNLASTKDSKILVFKGLLKEKARVEGTFFGRGEASNFQIGLEEDYPLGSVSITAISSNESRSLLNMKNSPVASFSILYPELGSEVNPQTKTKITNSFKKTYADSIDASSTSKAFLQQITTSYFQDYFDMNREAYNPEFSAATFSWEKKYGFEVGRNEGGVLSLGFTTYAFTGGAHGMQVNSVQNFDLVTGKAIELHSIIDSTKFKQLAEIITTNLKKERNLQAEDSLKSQGFFVNNIHPSTNVWMLNEGLLFVYNAYEIAPYSFGRTQIFVGYDQVKQLLSETAVVKKICNCIE